jgi:hypothetical protein
MHPMILPPFSGEIAPLKFFLVVLAIALLDLLLIAACFVVLAAEVLAPYLLLVLIVLELDRLCSRVERGRKERHGDDTLRHDH